MVLKDLKSYRLKTVSKFPEPADINNKRGENIWMTSEIQKLPMALPVEWLTIWKF